ncbi:protein EXECUTER 2, chloroplastic [Heracleum sosnowskyi]|uniref:Protein EXECUTER 2, chloroplastic n=1 Tax=Heracleum sosnowskyi TaxID=360622 RepID=A0AAD8H8Z2_9APIA|nr:protein EXECUTER 2, chloroplastic [Heracleum sosnowskyi]
MGVANAWATGHSVPVPHITLPLNSKKILSLRKLNYLLGWSCSSLSRSPSCKIGSRVVRQQLLSCRCSGNESGGVSNGNVSTSNGYKDGSCLDWDWNRWNRHFSEIEQAESFSSVLKFQLEDAIEKEDFQEAAKLKIAIKEATSKDSIAEIMSELKNAIDEERYHEASSLCRSTGSGLVGWWVGYSKDSDDPFGKLIHITPGVGRFVGKTFSPRQLVTASPGTPLFEIFVVKDDEETYTMQVVFLKRIKGSTTKSTRSSTSKSAKGPSGEDVDASVVDVEVNEDKSEKDESDDEVIEDNDSLKQIMEESDENSVLIESSEDESSNLDDIQPDQFSLGGGGNAIEDEKNLDMMKLFVGGILHNKDESPSKDEYMRVPGEIKNMERDSFLLHVPVGRLGLDDSASILPIEELAAISAKGASELMPPDVAKAFFGANKVSPRVSRDVREIVKLAASQAQKKEKLSEYTSFSRINTSNGDLDPFEGLYVGAFGPYGTEVVQLRRKYGNWNSTTDSKESSNMDFFEYVEAVKLTGDLNVPGGQVTFRVKVGQGNRLSNRGMYPDELGVVASYKGQGRIADFGFKNPKWVEGELLQLNGRGMGPYVKGADLGFLYVVPEQSFLVLFNRLKLPE